MQIYKSRKEQGLNEILTGRAMKENVHLVRELMTVLYSMMPYPLFMRVLFVFFGMH
jgi:hypothetical protein